MELVRDICQGEGCGILALIVNKRYFLCDACNFKRLHGGKSKEEVYRERHAKKEIKVAKALNPEVKVDKKGVFASLKKRYAIAPMSDKKKKVKAELSKTYHKIDTTREPVCEGCGRGDVPLSHSHLLSQYNRPDLITDEDNIRLHCFGNYHACHEKWERGVPHEVVEMLDFADNLDYIKSVDTQAYNAITANLEFNGIKKF